MFRPILRPDGYIPTEVKVEAVKGLVAGKPVYPKGMEVTISGDKLSVYEGAVKVMVTITPDKTLKPGKLTLPLTVHYQGCNDAGLLSAGRYANRRSS